MKKLMLVTSAFIAGFVIADVTSANVVGYQQKPVSGLDAEGNGGYTWCLSTLPSVGVSKDSLKLSSWSVTPPEDGLVSSTSIYVTTFDSNGQNANAYVYLDDAQCEEFGVNPGWYDAESIENYDPVSAGDAVIPFGVGVQISSDCGATVTFSGEVVSDDLSFVVADETAGGYTWTGNASPVDLTLANISVTPPDGGLVSSTSIYVTTFDSNGQNANAYVYLDDAQCEEFSVDPGWYDAESIENYDPVSTGDAIVVAGEMFQISSDCGGFITIPSAIE